MKIKCNGCEHCDVCCKKTAYSQILDDIQECVDNDMLGNMGFGITLDCQNYKTNAEYEKYMSSLATIREIL